MELLDIPKAHTMWLHMCVCLKSELMCLLKFDELNIPKLKISLTTCVVEFCGNFSAIFGYKTIAI